MKRKSLLFALLLALGLPWAAQAQEELTVYDGTTTSSYVPAYMGYFDDFSRSQYVIPATDLEDMIGGTISSIKFYTTSSNVPYTSVSTADVYIMEVSYTSISAFEPKTNDAIVYQGTLDVVTEGEGGSLTIEFSTPYTYGGDNLLVAIENTTDAGYKFIYFYGQTVTGASISGSNGSSLANVSPNQRNFIPKTTFTYTPGAAPSCPKPTNLAVSNVTSSNASFSWTKGGDETEWVLEYSTASNFTNAVSVPRSGIPAIAINDFAPATTYYAHVKAICGDDDESSWSNVVSFTTPCDSYDIPYTYGFEETAPFDCWTPIAGVTRQTSYVNNGSYSLKFSGTTSNMIALPQFNEATNNLRVEFWTRPESATNSYCGTFSVGYMTDITDASTFVEVANYAYNDWTSATYIKKTVDFNNAPASANIAFRHNAGSSSWYWFADDVTVKEIPSCVAPTALAADASTTSAELSWTANNGETAWTVYYKKTTDENYTDVPNATNPYTLRGLDAATNYEFYVVANCSANDASEPSEVFTFTTECEAIDLALVDYSENFDSYTAGNNVLPNCWSYINTTTNSTYAVYPRVYANSSYSTYANSAPNCLYFYSYGSSDPQPQYAILPEMTGLAGLQVTLMAKGYNATSTFKIGTMSDPTDASTFTMIAEQTLTTSYPTDPFEYLIPADCRDNYLAIMMDAAPSGYNTRGVYVDDIVIREAPTCLRPENLAFVSSTTTEATLSWTNGAQDQTAWQIAYSTDPAFNPDEVTPVDVTTNPGTISGLTAATIYYAYVRANCGNNDYSDWSTAYLQFATACEAITTFPVSYNFETSEGFPANASTPTTNQLGACWRNEATVQNGSYSTRVWGTSTTNYHEGSQALILPDKGNSTNFAKTMLVFPEMVFTSERGYTVSFWINRNGTNSSTANPEGFKVYISDTDTISANAVELGHYSRNYGIAYPVIESAAGWYQYEIEIPKSTMTGNVFLIFEGQSYYGNATYVDEVLVKETPTCQTPSGLALVSSTTTEATLGWTNGAATQTAWQIAYSTDPAFDPNEVTPTNVTSNPGIISGLTASTTYYAYVRANCGNDDYSDWSSAYVQFDTECEVIVVDAAHPFTEGFDGITSGIPVCWDNSEGTTSDASYRWNYYATGYKGHCVRFNSYNNSADNTNFLKTPVMNLPQEGENLQLSFWYKNPAGGDFSVYISTDGGDTYTTALASDLTDQSEWTKKDISLREYAGNENVVIVFAGTSNWGYDDAYIYLDEVFVGMPFTKTIAPYTSDGGYYLIASPLADAVDPTTVGMITDDWGADAPTSADCTYDFFAFDQDQELEWVNYRGNAFNMVNGKGYLYASKEGTTITFIGMPYSGEGIVTLDRTDDEEADFQGWNLVGNPFAEEAYVDVDRPFYVMDANGAEIIAETNVTRAIQPMEGIFVTAEQDGETMTFTTEAPGAKANLVLNITQGRSNPIDRAIISVGQGRTLPKFMLNPGNTKLYIPQNGEDYAVVCSRISDEIPVSFEPAENGLYTISVDVRNMNLRSLLLKDKVRNVTVDLLRTPSYQFKARTEDRADRFMLSFRISNSVYKETVVKGANSEDFGFFNNGNWIIDNEGEATLQVIDLNGRVLSSENIYGSTSIQVDAAPGVYMLRLVNGNDVKTQKVVVE